MDTLELDHVFVFVTPGAPEAAALGLCESYRRRHPGQGTANVCYCFDNAYLELLWVTDRAELTAPAVARTRLAERADWRRTGASPFGIALRGPDPDTPLPFESWDYAAPFLPAGMAIPVAVASDDPRQPFLFRSPGTARPDTWPDDAGGSRAGARQRPIGLAEIAAVERYQDERYVWEEEGPIGAKAGMNQYVWNLRTPPLDTPEGAVTWGYTGGAKVPPGRYRVRLTVGDDVQTQPFQVLKDPRLVDVNQCNGVVIQREHVGNAIAHRAGPDDSNSV